MNINDTCLQFHILNGNAHVTGHHKEFVKLVFQALQCYAISSQFRRRANTQDIIFRNSKLVNLNYQLS